MDSKNVRYKGVGSTQTARAARHRTRNRTDACCTPIPSPVSKSIPYINIEAQIYGWIGASC